MAILPQSRELDIVIPVYNEGGNIIAVLEGLGKCVKTPFQVLICYDRDDDDTLTAIRDHGPFGFDVIPVKNSLSGAHGAVVTGFRTSTAPLVIMFPADDTFNAHILDGMVAMARSGCDIVAASRFIAGGRMEGCPLLKAILVRSAAFTLYHLAGIPTHDATSGFRLFSRRVLDRIPIESSVGFTYSIELLVKCHRLGWRVGEVPALWFERVKGSSRFRVLRWLPAYLRWYAFAFATTWFRRPPQTVRLNPPGRVEESQVTA
jgi:dolichol-phosphate mannosyltransferase